MSDGHPPLEVPPPEGGEGTPAVDLPAVPGELSLSPPESAGEPPSEPAPEHADGAEGFPPLPPAPPERYPFWGYSDLALFLFLAVPCMIVGGLLALVLVKGVLASLHAHPKIPALLPLAEQFGGYAILFATLAMMLRVQYDRPFWASLAWTNPRLPLGWMVICGLVCAFAVAMLGSLIHAPTTSNPMTDLLKDRTSAILMACFGVTIAPLTEELAFRGFLQPLLVRTLGTIPGIVLAAAPFGLLHYREYGNSWRHVVLIALAGAAFGTMRHLTGSTKASAIMHASYNSIIFVAVFSK